MFGIWTETTKSPLTLEVEITVTNKIEGTDTHQSKKKKKKMMINHLPPPAAAAADV